MKKMFITKTDGYVLSIKIADLGSYAKNHSSSDVDSFIKRFARILNECKNHFTFEISAYRFFGSEFAMIVKNKNSKDIKELTAYLKNEFEVFGKEVDKK